MGSNEDRDGRLDLTGERRKARGSKGSMPWFEVPGRASRKLSILFSHWAALDRKETRHRNVPPLDTGCANGGRFTAFAAPGRALLSGALQERVGALVQRAGGDAECGLGRLI